MAKVRGNGEGLIRKRVDGRWEFRISINEKPKSYYFKTQKEAILAKKKFDMEEYHGCIGNDEVTFAEIKEKWLKSRKLSVKTATYTTYEAEANNLKSLDKEKVKNLKKSNFQEVFEKMALDGLSARYIKDVLTTARAIMEWALDDDIIYKNPVKKCTVPVVAKKEKAKDSFTKKEIKKIEESILDYDNGDLIYIMLNTGLRPQELCALSKDSLIKKGNTYFLNIDKALSRTNGTWELSSTKTDAGKRLVPVKRKVITLLKKRMLASNSEYLFVNKNGNVWNYTSFLKYYKKALSNIKGVRYLSPTCCRHSFATRLHWKGVDDLTIQMLMGHSDYKITSDVYTHVQLFELSEAINMLA